MSSYDERVRAYAQYGMQAIDRLLSDYAELLLSVDQKDAVEKIVAETRLRSDIPAPTSEDEAYDQLVAILGELLRDSKLKVADYGLSVLGSNQYRELVNRVAEVAPAEDPHATYADVIAIYNGPTYELNRLMKTEPFRTRFNEAVAAGLI